MRPDVRAVLGDEDRDVAHDADAALAGLPPDVRPLLEEEPLLELDLAAPPARARVAPRSSASASRFTSERSQVLQAAPPFARLRAMKQREVVEPGRVALRERLEGLAARRRRLLLEGGERLREERPLELDHRPEVHLPLREAGPLLQVRGGEQALVAQAVERDEQRVARRTPRSTGTASRRSRWGRGGGPARGPGRSPARKSRKAVASGPSSPMPWGPGSEVGWRRTPAARWPTAATRS